jgi:phenylpropionate dioxygenase-like ring-hydroxylating dioxygenase large terminal subunit
MNRYGADPASIRGLVRPDCIHRDVYLDPELFELEMARLWRNAWIYVGHDSQVPAPGDFYTGQIGREPVIMVRGADSKVRVLPNRCSHKGTKLVGATHGKCQAGVLRCPYHGWTYRLDGTLRSVPLKSGYAGIASESADPLHGLPEINSFNYRGFVFARLAAEGVDFQGFFGDSLSSIDNMVDRSPQGRLEVAGDALRYLHDCNWKMYVENLNDAMHPMVAHESSAGTAKRLWSSQAANIPKPMVIEQFAPFVNDYEFFEKMGVKVYPNGHSYTGVNFSIHSNYSSVGEYERRMIATYGEDRTRAILSESRHNTVYYPSLTIKGAIQAIRVARPVAVDRTIIESWTFRLVGAPEEMLARTATYSRLINAPTSMVGHDDLHCYRAIQEGLASASSDWVSLHRNFSPTDSAGVTGTFGATNEAPMRGQYRAWAELMTRGGNATA